MSTPLKKESKKPSGENHFGLVIDQYKGAQLSVWTSRPMNNFLRWPNATIATGRPSKAQTVSPREAEPLGTNAFVASKDFPASATQGDLWAGGPGGSSVGVQAITGHSEEILCAI